MSTEFGVKFFLLHQGTGRPHTAELILNSFGTYKFDHFVVYKLPR